MTTAKKINVRQEVQAVGFYLGEDEYAIYINKVREIVQMMDIRKIPKSPQFVEGVIKLREKIIPVLDLRKRFDLLINESNKQSSKILIVELEKSPVGLIVDSVSEVLKFYNDQIEKVPSMFTSNISSQYIQGVAKIDNMLVIILDVEKLLSFEEKSVLERIG